MAEDERERREWLSRRELLRRAGLGTAVLLYSGAAPKTSVAGVPKFRHRELQKTLRIIQWRHFVPAYDTWFDNTYTKVWGRKNDTEVIVDHINLTDLPARAASEVAARSGHDIFQHLSPPAAFEDQVLNLKDVVQDVTKKLGPQKGLARRSTYNPKTKKWFGMADNYVPDPVHYRRDWWGEAGVRPTTWDNVLRGAAKLKADGHPIGIGMSNELDSNMALIALMHVLRGLHPERRRTSHAEHEADPRRGPVHGEPLSPRHDLRRLRVGARFEQQRVPGRTDLACVQRDLDLAHGRGAESDARPEHGDPANSEGPEAGSRPRARDGHPHDLEVRPGEGAGEEVHPRPAAPVHRALPELEVLQLPRLAESGPEHQEEAGQRTRAASTPSSTGSRRRRPPTSASRATRTRRSTRCSTPS